MLKRLLLLGLGVVVISLVTPVQAGDLLDPNADILYHPTSQDTAESALTAQMQAVGSQVSQAYANAGDPNPPAPTDFFADSHTQVFSDLAAGSSGVFHLKQFDPSRTLPNGDPVGALQGVLIYFNVQLKSGRQVFDNQSGQAVGSAIADIGVNLSAYSDPAVGISFLANPRATAVGSIGADPDPNSPNSIPSYAEREQLTPSELDAISIGQDKLAAIIDPNSPGNSKTQDPIYTAITDPASVAAFVGTGTVDVGYQSGQTISHYAGSQDVVEWSMPAKYDVQARVVYLYGGEGVPEPVSMLLLAAGFPVLMRRRRKS